MSHTEEEARKKWCPHAFTFGSLSGGGSFPSAYGPQNRGAATGSALDSCRCIASECMAWRWAAKPRVDIHDEVVGYDPSTTHGYCGLAGKP